MSPRRRSRGTGQLVASTLSVARGGSATLEFTFSNLSTATKSFDINFYLSTNTIIRTIDDTLLGSNTGAWEAPDSPALSLAPLQSHRGLRPERITWGS